MGVSANHLTLGTATSPRPIWFAYLNIFRSGRLEWPNFSTARRAGLCFCCRFRPHPSGVKIGGCIVTIRVATGQIECYASQRRDYNQVKKNRAVGAAPDMTRGRRHRQIAPARPITHFSLHVATASCPGNHPPMEWYVFGNATVRHLHSLFQKEKSTGITR